MNMRQTAWLQGLNRLAPMALLLALCWLCWQLAAMFWLVLAPPQPLALTPPALGSQLQGNLPSVTGFNVFAQPQAAVPAPSAGVADVPMQLEGTMVAQPAGRSAAMIRINGQSRHYKIGQSLEGASMRLVAVAWGHVMLERADGTLARLRFGQQGVDAAVAAPAPVASPGGAATALSMAQQVDQALDDARNQLQSNPSDYLNRMGVIATAQGYEITEQLPADLRAQVGLRAGDRVISINGQKLGQPQRDALMIDQVKRQRQVQIEIQRGSQVMTIQQSF